ncbi:MAG: ABC transporter ATP-binding protein [Deltaproteobacteria bacterium]|nr:ABC transporter ATP-binding protein [Deltaproteobacteria bacterium]
MSLLEIENLVTSFRTERGPAHAVDGISLFIDEGETLGLVGESGCGKSMTALSIMQLVPAPNGRITAGSIRFEGRDLLTLPQGAIRAIRGNSISMIFQEPMTSLNPVFTIGNQILEVIRLHQKVPKATALARAEEMLRLVRIPNPGQRLKEYPHQLSGGMRQRVMIAMALACKPKLMIADEPTTALDVTIQAQILDLMNDLKRQVGMSILLITHDLGVISEMAGRVAVMYAGRIVEQSSVRELFKQPGHPYTRGLLASLPTPQGSDDRKRLHTIPGVVPGLKDLPPGCKFADRCDFVFDHCREAEPGLIVIDPGHQVRCWLFGR